MDAEEMGWGWTLRRKMKWKKLGGRGCAKSNEFVFKLRAGLVQESAIHDRLI